VRILLGLVYIAALHLVVALALLRPDLIDAQRWRAAWLQPEPSPYVAQSHRLFRAIDADAQGGRLLLIGDSQMQRLDGAALDLPAYNFAAGGDTMRHIVRRIADYRQPREARAVVLWAGVNDLLHGRDPESVRAAFTDAERAVPADTPLWLVSIAPVAATPARPGLQARIARTNALLAAACRDRCRFLDLTARLAGGDGALRPAYDSGDGLHLNRAGGLVVSAAINGVAATAP
jgi:lysophospholipase L1-like esterase